MNRRQPQLNQTQLKTKVCLEQVVPSDFLLHLMKSNIHILLCCEHLRCQNEAMFSFCRNADKTSKNQLAIATVSTTITKAVDNPSRIYLFVFFCFANSTTAGEN